MSKHTPGPWNYLDGDDFVYASESAARVICKRPVYASKHRAEWVANARLIAAAPDLLEALMLCKFDSLNMSLADLDFCRAAITKATGEII